jgi:stage II sporulation protein AA (anti-sigma F factor antagonist)
MFSVRVEFPDAGRAVVAVAGEMDLATAPALESALFDASPTGTRNVMVDLADVTFLDCRALGALLAAHQRLVQCGGRLGVRNADGIVRRILDLTGAAAELGLSGVDGFERMAG